MRWNASWWVAIQQKLIMSLEVIRVEIEFSGYDGNHRRPEHSSNAKSKKHTDIIALVVETICEGEQKIAFTSIDLY